MRNTAKQRNIGCVIAVLALCMLLTPGKALDYGSAENWAYFEMGEDREVDVFLHESERERRIAYRSLDAIDRPEVRIQWENREVSGMIYNRVNE